jgi:hypothetical protein
MAGVNDVANAIAQIKAMAQAIKRQQVASVAKGIGRVKAANTQNFNAPVSGGGGGGGGGGSAPVSTLASLPQTAQIKDLIAKGILKEGMPMEQIQAILSVSGLAGRVPIDIAALKAQLAQDYATTTGGILGMGSAWMRQMFGDNMPGGSPGLDFRNGQWVDSNGVAVANTEGGQEDGSLNFLQPGWTTNNGQWINPQGQAVGTTDAGGANGGLNAYPSIGGGVNSQAYANDPLFSNYADSLAQQQATSGQLQATDQAWFDKQQQLQTDYYNSLMASIANGTVGGTASGGSGGGGGGGGHHGGGGGGGGGGSGGGGDNSGTLGFGDTTTKVNGGEKFGRVATAGTIEEAPGNYQRVIDAMPPGEARDFAQQFMDIHGGDADRGLAAGRALQGELAGQVGGYDDREKLNLTWDAAAPQLYQQELNDFFAHTGNIPGDDPNTPNVLEPFHLNPNPTDEEKALLANYQLDPNYSTKYGPDSRIASLARAALDPMLAPGASVAGYNNVADILNRVARIRQQNLGIAAPTGSPTDLPFTPNPEPPGTPAGSETGTTADLPTLEELQSADWDTLSSAQQNTLIAAGMGPPDVAPNPDAPVTPPTTPSASTTTTLPQLSPDQVEQLLALDPSELSDTERQQLINAGAITPDTEPQGFANNFDPQLLQALAARNMPGFAKTGTEPPTPDPPWLNGGNQDTGSAAFNPPPDWHYTNGAWFDGQDRLMGYAPTPNFAPGEADPNTPTISGAPNPGYSTTPLNITGSGVSGGIVAAPNNTYDNGGDAGTQEMVNNILAAAASRRYNAGQREGMSPSTTVPNSATITGGGNIPANSPLWQSMGSPQTGGQPSVIPPTVAAPAHTYPPFNPQDHLPWQGVTPDMLQTGATTSPTYPSFNLQDHLPWQGIPPELTSQGGVVASDPMSQIHATVPGAVTAVLDQSQGTQPVAPSGTVGSITDALRQLPANLQAAIRNAIQAGAQVATSAVSPATGSLGIPGVTQEQWDAAGEGTPLITPGTLEASYQSTVTQPGDFGRPATLRSDILEYMHNQEQLRQQQDADAAGLSVTDRGSIPGQYWQGQDLSAEEIANLRQQQLFVNALIPLLQGGAPFIQAVPSTNRLTETASEFQGITDTATSHDDAAAALTGNILPAGQATDPSQLDVIPSEDSYNPDDLLSGFGNNNGSKMDLAKFLDASRAHQATLSGKKTSGNLGGGNKSYKKTSGGGSKKTTQNLASDRLRKIATAVGRTKVLGGVR